MNFKNLKMLHKGGQEEEVPQEEVTRDQEEEVTRDKEEVTRDQEEVTGGKKMSGERSGYDSYKVVMPKGVDGRYISKSPSQAAKKAVSKYFKGKRTGEVKIVMQKTTQGSNKKYYAYKGTKSNLSKPKEILGADGKVIKVVTHTTDVKKMEVPAEFQKEYDERRTVKKGDGKKKNTYDIFNKKTAEAKKRVPKKASAKKTAAKKTASKKAMKGGAACDAMSCNF